MAIDKRKNYYMVLDTETANDFDDPIVYDIGASIIDKKGNVRSKLIFISFAGKLGSTVICIVRRMFKVNQANG